MNKKKLLTILIIFNFIFSVLAIGVSLYIYYVLRPTSDATYQMALLNWTKEQNKVSEKNILDQVNKIVKENYDYTKSENEKIYQYINNRLTN